MTDDELVAKYAAEAKAAMSNEAKRRIDEVTDPEEEQRLRSTSLLNMIGTNEFVPALLARLGDVRAALDGHGGGIAVSSLDWGESKSSELDLVLVMSVVPGKGGQSFIPEVEGKVRSLREAIDFQIENGGRETKLMIDGGIKDHNAALVAGWGIDIAVVGSGLINNQASISKNLDSITNSL